MWTLQEAQLRCSGKAYGGGRAMAGYIERLIDAGSDEMYGTRVEPKVFLANERTFLNWLKMSVTLGSIASVPLSLTCTAFSLLELLAR